jgi:hypothetical protein
MKLLNNQGHRYETPSTPSDDARDATDTHQLSTANARPTEYNEDDVVQPIIVADDDDDIVAVSGLLLASMNNILREMEDWRRDRYSSRRLPRRRRHQDSREGPTPTQLPQALIGAEAMGSTTLLRNEDDDVDDDDDDSKIVTRPCKDIPMPMSIMMDIVDEALQVIGDHHDCDDQLYDFHFMPEETFILPMDPNSSKSTAKRYSCNREGDFIDNLIKSKSR